MVSLTEEGEGVGEVGGVNGQADWSKLARGRARCVWPKASRTSSSRLKTNR